MFRIWIPPPATLYVNYCTVSGCLICEEFVFHCYAVCKHLDSSPTQHAEYLDEELGDSLDLGL
jgi:hypothetical protein